MSDLGKCKCPDRPEPPKPDGPTLCPCCVRALREVIINIDKTKSVNIFTTTSVGSGQLTNVKIVGLKNDFLVETDPPGQGQGNSFTNLCEVVAIQGIGNDNAVEEVDLVEVEGPCDCCEVALKELFIELQPDKAFDIITDSPVAAANTTNGTILAQADIVNGLVRVEDNNKDNIYSMCHIVRVGDVQDQN